ncbi:hypothetical protein E2C01_074463 [Portunus trituberculatus]|uniref:Helix-turn-helix domain-containing protein n=1 Tax=Portunus trituberculatus TaxID=210409 RepID=A0A5B7IED2_PORTR|nr:hypothetical protein [Portunus trituberculatus]
MPFLDVLISQENEKLITTVYTKPTNLGYCLNGRSECPQKYKNSTIGTYIRRALTHCRMWKQVHKEIERSSQVLVNNGFSEKDIHQLTRKLIDSWYNKKEKREKRRY